MIDDLDGIPDDAPICGFGGGGGEDSEQTNNSYRVVSRMVNVPMWLAFLLKMAGMTIAWTFCALGLLAYLEKSAMFRPRVA